MSDKRERYRGEAYRRQRTRELRASPFSVPAFPEASRISIKHIAFLHVYGGESPGEIASRYPKCLTLADVHAALCHYFRDPDPINAEIKLELAFNRGDGLKTQTAALPRVGLSSLVDVA